MDVLLIVLLTLLNGVFAMSEMALASSRKARLAALNEAGDSGARAALKLMANPTQFLSTVQIGITSIGVLNGGRLIARGTVREVKALSRAPSSATLEEAFLSLTEDGPEAVRI